MSNTNQIWLSKSSIVKVEIGNSVTVRCGVSCHRLISSDNLKKIRLFMLWIFYPLICWRDILFVLVDLFGCVLLYLSIWRLSTKDVFQMTAYFLLGWCGKSVKLIIFSNLQWSWLDNTKYEFHSVKTNAFIMFWQLNVLLLLFCCKLDVLLLLFCCTWKPFFCSSDYCCLINSD